jgi:putative ABC transport system substrate-binding protein
MILKRRDFLTLLGGAAATWPVAARAQQAGMPVIGYLGSDSPADTTQTHLLDAFRRGLNDAGYVEGRNVAIEFRWAEGQDDRFPSLAADLVRRQVTVITALGAGTSARAAKAATTTIPIVFQVGGDPVELGLVASLNRPGGNLTGVASLNAEIGPKRLELLHELVPTAMVTALLVNANGFNAERNSRITEEAARALGLQLHVLHASTERDFDTAFASLIQLQAGGLVIAPNPFFNDRAEQIAALALRHSMPAISPYREFASTGGLMSYGGDVADQYRQVGVYTGRILRGEKPGDLPVQLVTKVELTINLKTAKALGLTVPITLLGRADEVIE